MGRDGRRTGERTEKIKEDVRQEIRGRKTEDNKRRMEKIKTVERFRPHFTVLHKVFVSFPTRAFSPDSSGVP